MNEFEMIRDFFRPLTMGREEAGALLDDAAILNVPDGSELVVSSDTLHGGVHFLKDEAPANIAHKALRVNLSDMAAMGAKPYCYQLNLAFSHMPDLEWAKSFTDALLADQKEFDVFCSGGDTTVVEGPMLVSMTMTGLVPKGRAVKRSGARAGDLAVVTGTIGDPAIGVKVLLKLLELDDPSPFLNASYKPVPRTNTAEAVHTHAHAAIDISDGLIADVSHIASASGLAAVVEIDQVPFSDDAKALLDAGKVDVEDLITGGDDYELALAVAPEKLDGFMAGMEAVGVAATVIGRFTEGQGVQVVDQNGEAVELSRKGWTHF
jgi:thiamine-monophosphate kinase